MTLPDLFVIGAQKSGTTSLHAFLDGHPDIFMSEPKEPGFFTPEVGYYPTDEDWYRGLFEGAGGARVVGESSTHYAKLPTLPGVPERIGAMVDEPRFIYVMRDPVDRAISHYWHDVRKRHQHRSILDAVTEDSVYVQYSDYPMQLEAYLERYPPERIFTLTFEGLTRSPARVLPPLLEWLDVDPDAIPAVLPRENVRPDRMTRTRGRGRLHRFRHSRLWEAVAPLVPKSLRRAAARSAVEPVDVEAEDVDAARDRIRPVLAERVDLLRELLGRDFPEWRTGGGS